ncbi:hypothetical protein Palpr_0008 [Paludibacter propionicigenes WB4]|uniref:Uncharacterized protein n=1 Tax=Paludibacter propionicigenes (strain DSM 17365 / JCM 13257 / WB4) TaxID=694427 RepID=E4T0B6_PALPW|nr:hypothetical protein [Paludibacter propionicigenes]ADQ78170.1 hypothetical protein Palpr_0008 [Paludibacter propionicigenes WB4]
MPQLSHFSPTLNKEIIRSKYNAPLLNYLTTTFKRKLVYFGLPSPDAGDIHEWIEYIEFVIAFQCREYPKPSDPNQSAEAVKRLEFNLVDLQRKGKILDFNLYDGYIEEVIINGKDNDLLEFKLDKFITLYNLDFCNEVTSPQKIFNTKKGEFETIYKLNIIKMILALQNKNNSHPHKFVLFLTLNANFWNVEAKDFEEIIKKDVRLGEFIETVSKLNGLEKDIRMLKAYVFKTLSDTLSVNNYTPHFLPVVRYNNNPFNLVQFTIIGTYEETFGRNAIIKQNILDFLNEGFISPNLETSEMTNSVNQAIPEIKSETNPVSSFCKSEVYNDFWQK